MKLPALVSKMAVDLIQHLAAQFVLFQKMAKTQPLDNLPPLAKANVPLLHVCASLDPWFKDNTLEVEKLYKKLGGKVEVIVKKGEGHYPLAPEDPAPVVDFITRAAM
jgi:pimeloyl-ACP methyl ester carboxylesterase